MFSMKTKTYSDSAFLEGVTKEEILEELIHWIERLSHEVQAHGKDYHHRTEKGVLEGSQAALEKAKRFLNKSMDSKPGFH